MYYNDDELERKLKSILHKYRVRYRSLTVSDDRVVVGIEGTKSDYPDVRRKASRLGITLVNAVYGRWVFKRN